MQNDEFTVVKLIDLNGRKSSFYWNLLICLQFFVKSTQIKSNDYKIIKNRL